MALSIKRATKQGIKIKAVLAGLPGAGKTLTGLIVATRLAQRCGGRLLVVDTEGGQSQTYADEFDFDVVVLEEHSPKSYVEAIRLAMANGYPVVLVDSFSHEWMGTNGVLQQVDHAGDKFNKGWGTVTPIHDRFTNFLVNAPIHIIGTVRQKIEHAQEVDPVTRKTVIRKLGAGDQQRDTFMYELAWHGVLDQQHMLVVDKSRYRSIPVGLTLQEPGVNLAEMFWQWYQSGDTLTVESAAPESATPATPTPTRATAPAQPQPPHDDDHDDDETPDFGDEPPPPDDDVLGMYDDEPHTEPDPEPAPAPTPMRRASGQPARTSFGTTRAETTADDQPAIEPQLRSLRNLCAALERPMPSSLTFGEAAALLKELSAAYNTRRNGAKATARA